MAKESKQLAPQVDLTNLSMEGLSKDNSVYQNNLVVIPADKVQQVKDILEIDVEDKENRLNSLGTPESKLASGLYHYEIIMNPKISKDYSTVELGKHNYTLFNLLIKVINTKQYELFVPMFDIVNFFFIKYKHSSYDEIMLNRADLYFAGDKRQLKTYQRLITIICILSNPSTRAKNKLKIFPRTVFNRDVTVFTEESISNLSKYYDLNW